MKHIDKQYGLTRIVSRWSLLALRIGLAILIAAVLLMLYLFPTLALDFERHYAAEEPKIIGLSLPYAILSVVILLCVLLCLVAIWAVSHRYQHGQLYSSATLRWIDIFRFSGLAGAVLASGGFGFLAFYIAGPLLPYLLISLAIAIGGTGLLHIVRQVFISAWTEHEDLAGVI
ncbi:MAG: DUF2975 domain-containing protein [Trueperella sp.]|nr:DUF2975 domain-containing protein [Trueperella sp.]